MIIEQEEEYDSDESVEDDTLSQSVSSIWTAKDETEWGSNPLPSEQTRFRTFCVKEVDLQQPVICLHQISYSSQ